MREGADSVKPFWTSDDGLVETYVGDALELLRQMPPGTVQCTITSPPYWGGIRDYGSDGQIGLERDPSAYIDALSAVFLEVRRLLNADGVLWLNLGNVYAASGKGGGGKAGARGSWDTVRERKGFRMPPSGFKQKDLVLIPSMVAERLRQDGWYLRAEIVWAKLSAVEPTRGDRPSVSHEKLYLFAKSRQYAACDPGEPWWASSVWVVGSDVCADHPATMPLEVVRRCVAASSQLGNMVLDPFAGSGTTGRVARQEGRRCTMIELNPEYAKLHRRRVEERLPEMKDEDAPLWSIAEAP